MIRKTATALAGLASLASSAWAQDVKPDGTWKWSTERNGQKMESTLKLKLEGDKLTGTVSGRNNTETPIEEASFKDGEVKFQVTRERDGQKMVTKYSGKISGDTLTGTIAFGERSREWKAERAK